MAGGKQEKVAVVSLGVTKIWAEGLRIDKKMVDLKTTAKNGGEKKDLVKSGCWIKEKAGSEHSEVV